MIIGINTLYVVPGGVGGAEYYLTNLLNGLARVDRDNRYVLFLTAQNEHLYPFPGTPNFRRVVLPFSNRNRNLRILYEKFALPVLARRESLDILHCPNNMAPRVTSCSLVLTIQSLHCFLYRKELPRLKMGYIRRQLRSAARAARHVITPSQSAREDAMRLLHLPPDRVTGILDYVSIPTLFPGGVRTDEGVLAKHGIPRPYIFSPSSMYRYKNITGMLRTLRELKHRHGVTHTLLLAGRDDLNYYPETLRLARELGVEKQYLYLGQVEHDDVPSLYRYADLTFFPTYCETFGIPVLESMAIGTPVVGADRSSVPEVAGGAAVLVDPDDVEGMARSVHRVLESPELRESLRQKGLARAAAFTCEQAARDTLAIYEKVYRAQRKP